MKPYDLITYVAIAGGLPCVHFKTGSKLLMTSHPWDTELKIHPPIFEFVDASWVLAIANSLRITG